MATTAYVDTEITSKAIRRVVHALMWRAPDGVKFTESPQEADIIVYHVNGRRDRLKRRIAQNNKPYAIIQYAFRSTLTPKAQDWIDIWKGAEVVWSYYDLQSACIEDGVEPPDNLLCMPLGVDPDVFTQSFTRKKYTVATVGLDWLTESVRECALAAGVDNTIHIGANLTKHGVTSIYRVRDHEVADAYSRSKYVSGLRRDEGFELPVIEGLLCGARPIVFDRDHYRRWFFGFAEFIPEEPREKVLESLTDLFKKEYQPVTMEERIEVRRRFDWNIIIPGFWNQIL